MDALWANLQGFMENPAVTNTIIMVGTGLAVAWRVALTFGPVARRYKSKLERAYQAGYKDATVAHLTESTSKEARETLILDSLKVFFENTRAINIDAKNFILDKFNSTVAKVTVSPELKVVNQEIDTTLQALKEISEEV